MKHFIYCMAIFAMMLLAAACHNSSSKLSYYTKAQDVQLAQIQAEPDQELSSTTQSDSIAERKLLNTEDYDHIVENKFLSVQQQPLSTFSIDVDRAAYSNVRRFIENGQLPPKGCCKNRRNDQLL
jgi:hypothetical protein